MLTNYLMILAEVSNSNPDWLNTAQQVLALITGIVGLISAGFGVFFGIKSTIEKNKDKSAQEIWALIITMADTAMKSVEESELKGEDKKTTVIEAVNKSAAAVGLDISAFTSQLNAYIDQTIDFVNGMKKNK